MSISWHGKQGSRNRRIGWPPEKATDEAVRASPILTDSILNRKVSQNVPDNRKRRMQCEI